MTHFSADDLRSRLGQTSMSLQSSLEPYPEARGDLQPVRKVAAPPRVVAPQIDSRHEITGVNTDAGERGRIDLEAAADVERQAVFSAITQPSGGGKIATQGPSCFPYLHVKSRLAKV